MRNPAVRVPPRIECGRGEGPSFFIRDVHLFDPSCNLDARGGIFVKGGRIAALGPDVTTPEGVEVMDGLVGCYVFPGFLDIHTHLRSPGLEYKEDIVSAGRAAAAGGYVLITGMANTDPPVDCGPLASWVLDRAAAESSVRVAQVGGVSRGLKGLGLSEMRELLKAGVVAFSDDGHALGRSDLLMQALRYLEGTGRPVLVHAEDTDLSGDGVMHEGRWSARLGFRGIPVSAETAAVARDLEILRDYVQGRGEDIRLHVQHVSTEGSVRLIRDAKRDGIPVTAEVTPHHLLLTDELMSGFDPNLKINPPLRSERDREALVAGLREGIIDCVATDHAPHASHEKEVPLEGAPFGTVGLETAFSALYGGLVVKGELELKRLVESMTSSAAGCLNVGLDGLKAGAQADFCVVDPDERWVVDRGDLQGKSRNSAFLGKQVQSRVLVTVVGGVRRLNRQKLSHA